MTMRPNRTHALYENEVKAHYRTNVWNALVGPADPRETPDLHALLFAGSARAPEVDLLLDMGFASRQLVVSGENQEMAEAASARLPDCIEMWSPISIGATGLFELGAKLSCANLDFCKPILSNLPEVIDFLASGVLVDGGRFAVTFLKARDGRELEIMRRRNIRNRFDLLTILLTQHGFDIKERMRGEYKNAHSPMGWIVYSFYHNKAVRQPGEKARPRRSTVSEVPLSGSDYKQQRPKLAAVVKASRKDWAKVLGPIVENTDRIHLRDLRAALKSLEGDKWGHAHMRQLRGVMARFGFRYNRNCHIGMPPINSSGFRRTA